jgi:hypothetical protein
MRSDPSGFLPIATTTCEPNICTTMFISTSHDTNSATSIPLGHSAPQQKVKRTVGEQHSTSFGGTFGMSGGNPAALLTSATGESTSSATEVADDEVGFCVS